MIIIRYKLILFLILAFNYLSAQPVKVMNSSEIQVALQKLNTLGSVLYIAAHPDDENTALLSYFASGKLLRTGYLSLTRGDGGQNLIGSEQGDLLGLIRTQELLQARKIDGAEQFFTRAFDFGFSKNPEETFKFWDKNKILSDVVWVIRNFRPDIIVTRFPVTGEGGHGHHTASAILAEEAFHIAGTDTFSNQLQYVKPWQPKRLFLNGWLPLLEQKKMNLNKLLRIDAGEFNTLLGKSYTEISAESRSMHKSQGFGSAGIRGESLNYFEQRFGDSVKADLFENIDLSWNRIPGTEKINNLLMKAYNEYDPVNPEKIVPYLVQAYNEMKSLNENNWIPLKMKEVTKVINSLLGVWFEAIAKDYSGVPGESITVDASIVNRSNAKISLKSLNLNGYSPDSSSSLLTRGKQFKKAINYTIPANTKFSQPYWLEKKHTNGRFNIEDQTLIGKPENDPLLSINFVIEIEGTEFALTTPVMFRWVDQVNGEKYRPYEILPPISINFDSKVMLFPDTQSKSINIHLLNNSPNNSGQLKINIPSGWKVSPAIIDFSFNKKNEEKLVTITITPPTNYNNNKSAADPFLKAVSVVNGREYNFSLERIRYDHIPEQVYLPESEIKISRFDSEKKISNIGYYMGAGDNIPEYLAELGYNVVMLNDNDLLNGRLNALDAVITGVRAYNTKNILARANNNLLDYVNKGGNLLVQYNVNQPLVTEPGPYSFTVSRDRVTDEHAEVNFTDPGSSILNYPNKITKDDFNGWIQERGLYFAGNWDEKYKTAIESSDPGEKPLPGGLIFTKYGKGNFVYTGYSFFRQIPAGIPGAVRLFVNLFSQQK